MPPNKQVHFDTDTVISRRPMHSGSEDSLIVRLFIKSGIAADKKSAEVLLIIIMVFCILLTVITLYLTFKEEPLPELTPEQQMYDV